MQNQLKRSGTAKAVATFRIACLISALMIVFSHSAYAAEPSKGLELIPGGMTFGAKLTYPEVMISELAEDPECPARLSGLSVGDGIVSVNGVKITGPAQLAETINSAGNNAVTLEYERNGIRNTVHVVPRLTNGEWRIGITVKNSSAGIGTVTFISENGEFGGLGHGICCKESGKLAPLADGHVCGVEIKGIKKGCAGTPGEIRGAFNAERNGTISANTSAGVFGLYAEAPAGTLYGKTPVASPSELHLGSATIISTLGNDGPKEYRVEITSVFEPRAQTEKGFAIKITDPELIERTGGIVQGMSGSPVLQDGKLVGAVTHVMVNDPTCGYGIFITTMLDSMPELLKP